MGPSDCTECKFVSEPSIMITGKKFNPKGQMVGNATDERYRCELESSANFGKDVTQDPMCDKGILAE